MDKKTARAFGLGFACGGAAALAVAYFPMYLVDKFYERQIETKAIASWERRAAGIDYEACRDKPADCVGKIVEWPVSRGGAGDSYWGGNQSFAIRWRNPQQVPKIPGPNEPFTAVARVAEIAPDAVVLVYIGTPQPVYGGTTWKEKFGAPRRNGESFAF